MNIATTRITCSSNSGLFIHTKKDNHPLKPIKPIPSLADFTAAVEKAIENHSRLHEDATIVNYLTRREFLVNAFGIPVYEPSELQAYQKIIPIPLRSNFSERSKNTQLSLFMSLSNLNRQSPDPVRTDAYDALAKAMGIEGDSPRLRLPHYNAFNFVGINEEEAELILNKNEIKFDLNKSKKPNKYSGLHYTHSFVNISLLESLLFAVIENDLPIDNNDFNIFIFPFNYNGHLTCGALVVNSKQQGNPIAQELFIFDSIENNSYTHAYHNHLIQSINQTIYDADLPPLAITLIPYGAQIDSINNYEPDENCTLYSIRAMNALVKILSSQKNSSFRSKICREQAPIMNDDNTEDKTFYINALAQALPEYFDYNPDLQTYKAKSFKERQAIHIADRWDLGRRFLKNLA